MYKQSIDNIKEGKDIRESLLSLKSLIKDEKIKRGMAYYLGGDYQLFIDLMSNSDPKIRRNSALIMGELEDDDLLPEIYKTYKVEKTLYIRADLLRAMTKYDYSSYAGELQNKLYELGTLLVKDPENSKHYKEEMKLLRQLLFRSDSCQHKLIAASKKTQLYLTAYPGCVDILVDHLKHMGKRLSVMGLGVMVYDTCIDELKDIRLYKELLLPVVLDEEYQGIKDLAELIVRSDLTEILRSFFDGEHPFTYRLQLKGGKEESSDPKIIKEIVSLIDKDSASDLVNAVGDYQIEIRVVLKKERRFALYIKTALIEDERFVYRKSSTSEAMKPVLAANICQYCSDYFKDEASVLDPFCGSGILLIERNKIKKTGRSMGIDLLDLAVEATKTNAAQAGYKINTVCKNFFDFENKEGYMADEIITDLPRVSSKRNEAYISKLYKKVLNRIPYFLKKGGYAFLYTNLGTVLTEHIDPHIYEFIEERSLKVKDGGCLIILRLR